MPSPARVTNLADLARVAGVSISTVSRALAGNPAISGPTRRRIVELAQVHGIQPNQMARNLRLGQAKAIGLVLPLGHEADQHVSEPFFMTMLGHVADRVVARGYDLLLSRVVPTGDDWLDRIVDTGRVDGAVVIGQSNQAAVLDRVAARFLPLMVWGAALPGQVHCTIGTDNRLGGRLATQHLIDTGRTRLAFLGIPLAPEIAERRAGFLDACAAAGPRIAATTMPVHLTPDTAHAMIAEQLSRGALPDGLVAASDVVAMSALRALAERGLRVPRDVAVVGFDDVALAAQTSPPLTTIRQDIPHAAELLVDALFRRMAGERTQPVVLPPELVIRGSTIAG